MMPLFASALLLVKCFGPAVVPHDVAGVFVKGLTGKFRAAMAHVNDFALAALFSHGRDAVKLLGMAGLSFVALGGKGQSQTESQSELSDISRAQPVRKMLSTSKSGTIVPVQTGLGIHKGSGVRWLLDELVLDGFKGLELEHGWLNQRRVFGQGLGFLDALKTIFHGFFAAAMVGVEEFSQGDGSGFFDRREFRPFEQKVCGQRDGHVLKEQFGQRIISL